MATLDRPHRLPEISVPDHDELDSAAVNVSALPYQRQDGWIHDQFLVIV
jgi:hypothetical protein